MDFYIGDKYLITTDAWFIAPNGSSYRAVFGTVKAIRNAEQTLGIKVRLRDADWFLCIGDMIIAGCQIKYAIKTVVCNTTKEVDNWSNHDQQGIIKFKAPNSIYDADKSKVN